MINDKAVNSICLSSFPTGEDGRGSCFFLYATIALWGKVMFRRKQRKIQPHFSSKEKSEHKKSNKVVTNKLVSNKLVTNKVVSNKLILYLCSQKQFYEHMAIENPFVFGKAAEGGYFTDRAEDAKRLNANLTHGINTILISPRRWGKTSLVKKVISEFNSPDIVPVFIDIFQCKSEYEFYHAFATTVIKQTSSKLDEWIETAKTFLANVSPKFSFGTDPMNDFSLTFEWNPKDDTEADILQLPEKIAQKKNIHLVVCLDEFQQIADFNDSLTFQKKLRSIWQHQQNVTYCMFGSKKHLMENIFNDKSMPFYKFGDMMFLKKIPSEEWIPFICTKFKETGKTISPEQASKICEATENLSSYVQHLAWVVWYKSEKVVTNENVTDAIDDLLEQNKVFFQREVEMLSELQINFLRALANGITTGFSRKEVINKYRLESSANVQSVKKALLKKDIIDVDGREISFNDSLFKLWLKRQKFYE